MMTENPVKQRLQQRPVPIELAIRTSQEIPHELSLTPFKSDLEFAFLFDNFVWSSYGTPWLEQSAAGKLDRLSHLAARAFAQTIFGSHHHLKAVKAEGSDGHTIVLRVLSEELGREGAPGTEALIIPIMILLIHAVSRSQAP